jgi:fibronectin type 3 domain-containing protein
MDMMRPMAVGVARSLPVPPTVTLTANANGSRSLAWTDGTPVDYSSTATWGNLANEVGFRIERATIANNGRVGTYALIGNTLANQTQFTDTTATTTGRYSYRVAAWNAAGASTSAPVGGVAVAPPLAPTNALAVLQTGPQVRLTWTDNATTETSFLVERSVDGGAFVFLAQVAARSNTGTTAYVDKAVSPGRGYQYRVAATNAGGTSAYATSNAIDAGFPPAAPSNLTGSAVRSGRRATVTLKWVDNATTETGFTIERATNPTFTVGLTTINVAANAVTNTQSNLYRGVTYYFRIKSRNLTGFSAWSNTAAVVTP